jgi:D-glycerate 3-kinase
MEIAPDLTPLLRGIYLPLAAWLDRRRSRQERPLVVGLCGAQGSGKSTISMLMQTVLAAGFEQRVASLSIDDIYKTKVDREVMARTVHPLFATRGVPGTHDVELGIDTISKLLTLTAGRAISIPAFDKARDDRRSQESWPTIYGPVDVIIFEGWCVGALPQPGEALTAPLNDLERNEDPDSTWRKTANEILAKDYQKLFSLIDVLLMLTVEGMDKVFEWRRLQEQKLAKKVAAEGSGKTDFKIMSDSEINRFVMHYERLTRHILNEMPQRADIVLFVNETHSPARVQINKPLTQS